MELPNNKRKADFELLNPKDFTARVRANAVEKLPPHTIHSIRGLLLTNAEILERCKGSLVNDDKANATLVTCTRKSFNTVKVQSILEHAEFIVFPKEEKRQFVITPLVQFPPGLDLFQPTFDSGFINFTSFFDTSLLLHDDIMQPLLLRFKNHLEDVQVCLGEIEQWITEPLNNICFLEETFAIELGDRGKEIAIANNLSCDGIDCSACGERYESHNINIAPATFANLPIMSSPRYKVFCPRSNSVPFCTSEFMGKYQSLQQIPVHVKLEASFNISKESERLKLMKCLEFAKDMNKLERRDAV